MRVLSIETIAAFLLEKFISETTIGSYPINAILKEDLPKRRKLERQFVKQIGISPRQLGKVIRLQAVLKLLLNRKAKSLTKIACESEYYDQAHFIKDFREFTGIAVLLSCISRSL